MPNVGYLLGSSEMLEEKPLNRKGNANYEST